MNRRMQSAQRVSAMISALKCPICNTTLSVVEFKSVVCLNQHTFDFSKQGYLNFTSHASSRLYSQELFESRQSIMMHSDLYTPMHEMIAGIITKHQDEAIDPLMVADVGCGEGSHLNQILNICNLSSCGVGLDIAKEGIRIASKHYPEHIWLVGDLAKSPLGDASYHVILNILSPSNYKEFKRILKPGGLVIKVVPGPEYLKELRESLFDDLAKRDYQNESTTSLFKSHFQLLDVIGLNQTNKVHRAELRRWVEMTPLAWSADPARKEAFINREFAEITVDLSVLVGKDKKGTAL